MCMSGHKTKILKAVILSDVIDVMNNFVFCKSTTDVLCHYINMLHDISLFARIRMFWHEQPNITLASCAAAVPHWVFVSEFRFRFCRHSGGIS